MGNISKILKYELEREVYTFMIKVSNKRKDIIQYFSEKWTKEKRFKWDEVSEDTKHRTIDNYIKSVRDTYFSYNDEEKIYEKGRSLSRLDYLFSQSVKIQDWKTALQILKEIREIVGYAEPTKQEITISDKINKIKKISFKDTTTKESDI